MSDRRPSAGASSFLRRTIFPWSTELPLVSADPFNIEGKLIIGGEETVKCSGRVGDTLTGCDRGLDGEARKWLGGTAVDQELWTAVEVVTDIPTVLTEAMEGRQFMYRAPSGDLYAFNVVAKQAGTRYIEWVNEPPPDPDEEGRSFLEIVESTGSFTSIEFPTGIAFITGTDDAILTAYPEGSYPSWRRFNWRTGAIVWSQSPIIQRFSLSPAIVPSTAKWWAFDNSVLREYDLATGAQGTDNYSFASWVDSDWPQSVVYDTANHCLWIADYLNGRIRKHNAETGAFIATYDNPGLDDGVAGSLPRMDIATLAMGPDGKLYGAGDAAGKVRRFNVSTGDPVLEFSFGEVGNIEGTISATVAGLAIEPDSLRVWVVDSGNHRVSVFEPDGTFVADGGGIGSGDSQFNNPLGANFDADGRLWVADYWNDRFKIVTLQVAEDIELGFEAYTLQDEFIGGGNTSGAIGELGWLFNGNGTYAAQSSTTAHPGVGRTNTSGTANNNNRLSLGPWTWNQVERMDFIFAPAANGTATSILQRAGFLPQSTAGNTNPSDGVFVDFDPVNSGNFILTRKNAGATQNVFTTMPVVAAEFYLARFERTDLVGGVKLTLVRLSTGQTYTGSVSGLSTTMAMDACFANRTTNGTAKVLDIDYWSGRFSGLNRA